MNCTVSPSQADRVQDSDVDTLSTSAAWKSDRKSLISHSLVSLIDQAVVSGCTFFTIYLVSGQCSKAELGAFALAATIVNFIRTVQERVIAAPYLAFAYKPGFDRNSYRGSSFVHQGILAIAVAAIAITVLAIEWWFGLANPPLAIVASLALTIPLLMVRDQIRAISAANFEFSTQLVLDIAIGVLQFVVFFCLAISNRFTISNVYVAMGLACLIPSVIWLGLHRQSLEIDLTKIASDWRHNWRYSRWLVAARAIGILGYSIVPWMVAYYLNEAATGEFAVCSSLVGISLMFVTGLNNYFQPRTIREFHRSGVAGLRLSLIESIAIVSGILVAISLGFALFGNSIVGLFGKGYGNYGYIAFLLSISTLTVSFSVMFGNGLAALGNSRHYFWGEFACCAVSVSSAVILIPLWGLAGAAESLILGGLASSIVTGINLARAISLYKPTSLSPVSINECAP